MKHCAAGPGPGAPSCRASPVGHTQNEEAANSWCVFALLFAGTMLTYTHRLTTPGR